MKTRTISIHLSTLVLLFLSGVVQANATDAVTNLQLQWAKVNYTLVDDTQNDAFEALAAKADNITKTYPNSAEAWIWNGIIKSSYAGAKGGLGALGLVKDSRIALEKALKLNPDAMEGSAYTSLGTLYFKVPGWPIAFGDDEKAVQLLQKALKINPNGIDANFFYADFLQENEQYAEAKMYLLNAQHAAPRLTRPLADKGRQQQISELLASVEYYLQEDEDELE